MRKMMVAVVFTAACGSVTMTPNGNNNGSGTGSDTGSDMGSDMGSGSGSDIVGTPCTTSAACGADGACDLTEQQCVAPVFAFDHTGFIDDGTRWWTNKSNPTIHGSIANPAGQTLTAYLANTAVGVATVTGTTWSLALPAGAIAETGTNVVVRMSSASGDTIEQAQLLALDDKAPTATLTGSLEDERGDQIDFSTGEAVHTHAGAAINLGGTGCPSVYKYAYLEDETAPAFGRQTTPNPLAWQIQVSDSTGIDSMDSAYRVRDAAGHILYDWTSIQPDSSGSYAVALYRNKIAALGTQLGHMFVDVRFRDGFGNESTTSACWDNHPMAAPLQIGAFSRGELFGWTLAADSPISRLMSDGIFSTTVFSQSITQYGGEPIVINFSVPAFSMPYTLAAVDNIVAQPPVSTSYTCSPSYANCTTTVPADPPDRNTSGAVSSSEFEFSVADNAHSSSACYGTGSVFSCTIPARTSASGPLHYTLTLRLRDLSELQPFNEIALAVYGEYTLLGLTYTGQQPANVATTCTSAANGQCVQTTTYTEFRAADRITLQFPALTQTISTTLDAGQHWDPVPYATGALTLPAKTWDSGNDVLPGQ